MNKQYMKILAAICAVLFIAGCASDKVPKPTVWGRFQEPFKPAELAPDSGIDEITVAWRKTLGGNAQQRYAQLIPAFANQSVIMVSPDGNIASYQLTSGKTGWITRLDSPVSFGVGLGGGMAVVGHVDGSVTALHADDGEVAWTTALKSQISAVPAVSPLAVVIRSSDGRIIGLDPEDGEQLWLLESERAGLTMQGASQPVLDQDIMLIGLGNGKLLVGNSSTGRLGWEVDIGTIGGRNDIDRINDIDSPPIMDGTTAYAAAYRSNVKAIDLNTTETLWTTRYSTRLPMDLGYGNLYMVSDLGELAALDVSNGNIVWSQEMFRGHGMSPPVSVNGRVLIGDSQGRLHSLDPRSGQLIDTQNIFSGAVLSVVKNGQSAAVFTSRNELALIDIAN